MIRSEAGHTVGGVFRRMEAAKIIPSSENKKAPPSGSASGCYKNPESHSASAATGYQTHQIKTSQQHGIGLGLQNHGSVHDLEQVVVSNVSA